MTTETEKLLRCPFCGGNDIRLKEKGDIRFYRCFSCRSAARSNNKNPVTAWNTRAALQTPRVPVIPGLDEAIYVLKDLLVTNELHDRDKSRFKKIIEAARWVAEQNKKGNEE